MTVLSLDNPEEHIRMRPQLLELHDTHRGSPAQGQCAKVRCVSVQQLQTTGKRGEENKHKGWDAAQWRLGRAFLRPCVFSPQH